MTQLGHLGTLIIVGVVGVDFLDLIATIIGGIDSGGYCYTRTRGTFDLRMRVEDYVRHSGYFISRESKATKVEKNMGALAVKCFVYM
jgi:hypothetical protein